MDNRVRLEKVLFINDMGRMYGKLHLDVEGCVAWYKDGGRPTFVTDEELSRLFTALYKKREAEVKMGAAQLVFRLADEEWTQALDSALDSKIMIQAHMHGIEIQKDESDQTT